MKYNFNYKNANGEYAPKRLIVGDMQIINPTAEQYAEQGYLPFTYATNPEVGISDQIELLKYQLSQTDYIALKYIEGYDCDTIYPNWKQDRANIRTQINTLQEQLENGEQ